MSVILITGSNGLVGSESVNFFCDKGYKVIGIDNDLRGFFFGKNASTKWLKKVLLKLIKPLVPYFSDEYKNVFNSFQ